MRCGGVPQRVALGGACSLGWRHGAPDCCSIVIQILARVLREIKTGVSVVLFMVAYDRERQGRESVCERERMRDRISHYIDNIAVYLIIEMLILFSYAQNVSETGIRVLHVE